MVSLLVSEVGGSLDCVIVLGFLGSRGLWLVWLVGCFSYALVHCFLIGLVFWAGILVFCLVFCLVLGLVLV